jgi:hypothetical protein
MAVQDYDNDGHKEKQLDKELEDKAFRDSQREEKKIQELKLDEPGPGEEKKGGLLSKIVPEKTTPTQSLMDKLNKDKKDNLKKPRLHFQDESSDDEGNSYTNSKESSHHESTKYVPPKLALDINASQKSEKSQKSVASLRSSKRSSLSKQERRLVDQEVIADAIDKISQQSKSSKMKNDKTRFTPNGVNRITANQINEAIKKSQSGSNASDNAKLFDKTQSMNQREMMEAFKA